MKKIENCVTVIKQKLIHRRLSSAKIIIYGFMGVILLGTLLLMLPVSSRDPGAASFADCLFTSVSATCVTGLIVQDTGTYWTPFGQAIILILIQIGGLGILTISAVIALFSGRKIGLIQRSTMQEAISAPNVGGIVKLTIFLLKGVVIFEIVGTVLLMPVFIRDFGIKGIWYAVFHSVSAFCNAGFDLMGVREKYSSLTSYSGNAYLVLIISALITIGGIGFLTWEDIRNKKWQIHRYRLQTKVILIVSAVLVAVPTIYLYFGEFKTVAGSERFLDSLFQAVTLRTAGFNTADFNIISPVGIAIMIPLMLIGGSPGSTAGGMKTTTVAVMLACCHSVYRRREETSMFGRRIEEDTIRSAAAILMMYTMLFFVSALFISKIEGLPLMKCFFETASAIGTVGVTMGITPTLGLLSRTILIVLMFSGRVGGLTVVFAAVAGEKHKNVSRYPKEKITVG